MSEESPAPQPATYELPNSELSPAAKKWTVKIIAVVAALVIFQIPLYMVGELAGKRKEQASGVSPVQEKAGS